MCVCVCVSVYYVCGSLCFSVSMSVCLCVCACACTYVMWVESICIFLIIIFEGNIKSCMRGRGAFDKKLPIQKFILKNFFSRQSHLSKSSFIQKVIFSIEVTILVLFSWDMFLPIHIRTFVVVNVVKSILLEVPKVVQIDLSTEKFGVL